MRYLTQMNLVIAADGLVQRISLTFDSDNFDATESALIEKFGKPTQTQNAKASNAMGATFDQVEHTWNDSDGKYRHSQEIRRAY